MSRLIHFLARLYPRSWRQRYGAEFEALLEDVRPDGRTAANVLTGALAMQVRTWKSWGILAVSALVGAAVVAGLFVAMPKSYVSNAVVNVSGQADQHATIEAINALAMDVESRGSLVRVITTYNLYLRERSRMPLEDVIDEMKKQIIVEPVGANLSAFAIRFSYTDPHVAQNVTQELIARFMDENVRQAPPGVNLQLLDPPSLPQSPFHPNKPLLFGLGVACSLLMWGGLSAWRSVSARRYAASGASISSGGSPIVRAPASGSSWKILLALALLIAVATLSFNVATSSYESAAVIRVLPLASPQANADFLVSLVQLVEDRFSLARIINTYNLYPDERDSLLGGDVIEQMKKHIRVEPLPPGSKSVAGILIGFSYPERHLAQKVTEELTSQFIKASSADNSAVSLSVLDPASLPEHSPSPVEPRFGVGLFFGLLLGVILAVIVALVRRSPAAA